VVVEEAVLFVKPLLIDKLDPPAILTLPPVCIKGLPNVTAVPVIELRLKVPEEPCVVVPAVFVVTVPPALIVVFPDPAVENELLKFKVPVVKATFPSVMVVVP
jgi:hypothetical protein